MDTKRNVKAIRLALKHYMTQIKRDWKLSIPALVLPGIGSILIFYIPTLIVARVLVRFNNGSHPTVAELLPYIGLFAGVWALGEILWRIAIHLLIKTEAASAERLYNQGMDYILEKDLAFFNDNFVGSLTKKVVGYARNYDDFLDTLAFAVTPKVITLIFTLIILWQYTPALAITLVVILLICLVLVAPLIRRRQALVTEREAASNIVAGHVSDVIGNITVVRAFARDRYEAMKHRQHVADYMKKTKRSWDYQNLRIDAVMSPIYVVINTAGLVIALLLSQNGQLDLAAVFVSFVYYTTVTEVMWEFNRIYRNLESALTEAGQFTELLLEDPKLTDPTNPQKLQIGKGEVELRNVSFRYQDSGGEHLFKNLNLKIRGGEKLAIVGHSGGGKTTITKLLLRFMDIDEGQILIDGQNIAQVKQSDLRSNIAYVPQDPAIFHRSLKDNIRYGRLNSTDKEVEAIAKLAHIDEFITRLPKGYETLVGERGVKLSGGQRQRVAIARAMLKDAPILVLDEATSSLDSASEKLIQDALWKLMEGRTAIVIAHRLSTIQKMDRIVVLEEGQVTEQGTHQELLDNSGIYAQLWAHQSGGFLKD